MFEAHVSERVLALTMSDAYKSEEEPMLYMQVVPLCHRLAFTLATRKWELEKVEFHAMLSLLLELIETDEEKVACVICKPLWMLLVIYLSKQPDHVWSYKFSDAVSYF
jgi:hypothetical protein